MSVKLKNSHTIQEVRYNTDRHTREKDPGLADVFPDLPATLLGIAERMVQEAVEAFCGLRPGSAETVDTVITEKGITFIGRTPGVIRRWEADYIINR